MEKQWSCGCIEVDGQLAEECTQVQPSGPLQSHQRVVYSPVCFRKRVAEPEVTQPEAATEPTQDTANPLVTEATDGVQE